MLFDVSGLYRLFCLLCLVCCTISSSCWLDGDGTEMALVGSAWLVHKRDDKDLL